MSNKDKEIIIRVEGGLIQSVENIPKGVVVKVYDYDTDGTDDEDLLSVDENGDDCSVWVYDNLSNNTKDSGLKKENSVEELLLLDELAGEIKGIVDLLYNATKSEIVRIRCEEIEDRVSTIQGECSKLINKIENPNS